jgi:molybdopterin/thiamine biosynthesis adenylyltransferase/rhodanese-related sulfurtransferase
MTMDNYLSRLIAARARIREIEPPELDPEAVNLVDIREPRELAIGRLFGAINIPMSDLQGKIGSAVPDHDAPIVLYCAVGERSAIAAAHLEDMGYTNVASLAGGIKRWMGIGLPTIAAPGLGEASRRRYARHIALPQVGVAGQQRLLDARVLIVGAGGLGSPVALYLAAAGVGTIGLVDDDVVEMSNLQRQILHTTLDEGVPKTASGAHHILDLNPQVAVAPHQTRLTAANAIRILSGYDIVVDGTDNFATRYLINDASMHVRIPVVHGSVFRFEGQVAVFNPYETACYRCVFPAPPPPNLAPSCTEAGVLGVLPGVIGTMQATEVLKIVLGIGEPLYGKLLTYDALDQTIHTVRLERNPLCPSCGGEQPPPLRTEAEYC